MATALRTLAILLILFVAGLAAFQYSSKAWPTVTGIVDSGVVTQRDKTLSGKKHHVIYNYQVAGVTYTGTQIGFSEVTTVIPIIGVREPRQPREGDEVTVFYLPVYPALALLVPGPPPTLIWWVAITMLVAILLWATSNVMKEPVF